MILHTVAFRTRHAPGSAAEAQFLAKGMALAMLPMVMDFQCYRQVSRKNDFSHGFSMRFASQPAYDAYNTHPLHTAFVEDVWKPEVVSFMELDYVAHQVA